MAAKSEAIAAAKLRAVAPPAQAGTGPEWPRWEDVPYEDALVALEVFIWSTGAKVSLGIGSDGKTLWGRLSVPKWSQQVGLQGKSAITFSSGMEHLLRKMSQLADHEGNDVWKPDPYAR